MKHLQKTAVLLAMVLMISCDENMMGAGDASIPESCILYVAPGAEVDGGDGASESTPLSTVEGVMSKTAALKSECKAAAEVRFAEGALSEEQYKVVREGLNAAGIRVGKYVPSKGAVGAATEATVARSSAILEQERFETAVGLNDRFPGIAAELGGTQDMTSRLFGSCTDYYVVTGTNPYYKLDSDDSTYVDWVFATNSGNLALRRSTVAGSGTTGERIGLRSNLTPSSAVDISGFENSGSGSGNGILRLYKGTTTSTPMIMDNNEIDSYDTAGLHLNNNSTQDVYIAGNTGKSNNVYMVRGSGKVAIGNLTSTQTTHKLTVDGGIKAEELVLDAVGADFVFEDDYDLMSLDEVESFVEENKHLPGVAPAKDMQQNGLSMGEFQIKLLQKVEELTLYAIEQNKRIKELEQKCER